MRSPHRRPLVFTLALAALLIGLCVLPACHATKAAHAAKQATASAQAPAEQDKPAPEPEEEPYDLAAELAPHLAKLGARNWVIIADPTYPVFSGSGVTCITVPASSYETLQQVLDVLEAQGSLTPRIWIDRELEEIGDDRAPGIKSYRKRINDLISGRPHYALEERFISRQVQQAGKTYSVLIIKTNTQLPYSSIAIELDTGYWNQDAEEEVRQRIKDHSAS